MLGIFKSKNKTIQLTDNNWDDEITHYSGTALVDVWAPWCGPCKLLGPLIDEISLEVNENIKVCKLNSDEE
jgi:thioredoxin 1